MCVNKVKEINWDDDKTLGDYLEEVNQPIVFRGIANDWPLVKAGQQSPKNTADYLLSFAQPMMVGIGSVAKVNQGRLFYNKEFNGFNFERQSLDFSKALALLLKAASSESADDFYLGSTSIDRLFPQLRAENNIKELEQKNPLVNLWLSNKTHVAAHQDFPDNLAICVAGKRRFTLFPPEQTANLYIGPLDLTPAGQPISLVNHANPDLNAHPNYQQALDNSVTAELLPGDALLLPSLWWHAVESLTSFNMLVNFWWQNTPLYSGSPMDALLHSVMNIGSLSPAQKSAMKTLFDYYVFEQHNKNLNHIPEQAKGILNSNDEMSVRKARAMLLNKLNQ